MFRSLGGKYRRKIWLFVSASLCLIVLYTGYRSYVFVVGGLNELRQAIEEADHTDPEWSLSELENSRALIPDNENSALQVLKVDRLIPANWWEGQREESSSSANGNTFQLLETTKNALLEARKLQSYQKGRFAIPETKLRFFRSTLTEGAQKVALLLDWDARLLGEKGQTDRAMSSCRAMLAVARSIGDEPAMVSQQFRVHIRNIAAGSIQRTLTNGEVSEKNLREAQDDLEIEESQPLLLIMARAERASFHERLKACEDGYLPFEQLISLKAAGGYDLELFAKPMLPRSHAWIIRYFNQVVETCKGPTDNQRNLIQNLAASANTAPAQVRRIFGEMPELYLNITDRVLTGRGRLRCAIAALACERFRLRNHRWPNSLTELVPDYLKEIPCDPVHGTRLEARMLEDKMIVYFPKLKGPSKPGSDSEDIANSKESEVSFTLWMPSQRGKIDQGQQE